MAINNENKEIECRFLEIDKQALIKKLHELGAEDKGEMLLTEVIVYDKDLKWSQGEQWVKIRTVGETSTLSYKERVSDSIDGTYEVEFEVNSAEKAEIFLKKIGMVPYRHQEKFRHTFILDGVTIDIDTWPKLPPYVEFESSSEESIKKAVDKVGFSWSDVTFERPAKIIEGKYGIFVRRLRYFTFDKIE
jgi:adenylate cyclase class 2